MKKLLTADEVAELLAIDVSTVHRWARAGTLPAFRYGRVVRFDPDALNGFISGQTVGTPSPTQRPTTTPTSRVSTLRAAVLRKAQDSAVA